MLVRVRSSVCLMTEVPNGHATALDLPVQFLCDLDWNDQVNAIDIQLAINSVLGIS